MAFLILNERARGWSRKSNLVLTALPLALASQSALAQTGEVVSPVPDRPALPEQPTNAQAAAQEADIVVTALRTGARLQDVPATVAVLGGSQIAERGVMSLEGLTALIPGFATQSPPLGASATIRGVGSSTAVQSFDGSVGLFFDGVFAPRTRDLQNALFDVEDVQVVKGTQASVLGKNTSVGAVVIRSRRPGRTVGFDALAQYEVEYKSATLSAGVDLPASDTLFFRVAGRIGRTEGYYTNDITGRAVGGRHTDDVRVSAVWDATPALDIFAYYQYSNVRNIGLPFELATPGTAIARAAPFDPFKRVEARLDYHTQQSDPLWNRSEFRDDNVNHRAVLEANYKLGSGTLTSLTGFSQAIPTDAFYDGDILPGTFISQFPIQRTKTFSTELRYASAPNKPFNYLVGTMYYQSKFNWDVTTYEREPTFTCATRGVRCGASFAYFDQFTRTYAAFGQVQVKPIDWLEVTGGARYTHETKDATYETGLILNAVAPDGFVYPAPNAALIAARGGAPIPRTTLSRSEQPFDYSVAATIHLADRLNVYGSYGKGSKSGGFQSDARTTLNNVQYAPETANTAEVGVKWSPRGAHVFLSAYDMKIKGFQDAFFNGTRFVLTQYPVRVRGFEVDLGYSPLPGLDLAFVATYADAERSDTRQPLARAPEWSGNGRVSYSLPLNDDLSINAAGDLSFRSPYPLSYTAFIPKQDVATQKLDLRVGLESKRSGWTISVIGRNLTNVKTINSAAPSPPTLVSVAPNFATVASLDAPRTVMLQLMIRR